MNELLNLGFLSSQCQRHNATDMHIWPIDVHVKLKLLTDGFDVLETFLVVGACAADPDLDLVLDESGGKISKGTNDTFER